MEEWVWSIYGSHCQEPGLSQPEQGVGKVHCQQQEPSSPLAPCRVSRDGGLIG